MINKIKHGVSVKCWPERRAFLMDVYMYGAEQKLKGFRVMEACTGRLEGERFANGCSARFAVCRDGEGVAVNLNAEYLAA